MSARWTAYKPIRRGFRNAGHQPKSYGCMSSEIQTLERHLHRALRRIQAELPARFPGHDLAGLICHMERVLAEPDTNANLLKLWHGQTPVELAEADLRWEGLEFVNPDTKKAKQLRRPPDAARCFELAVAFLIEADRAYTNNRPAEAWGALLEGHYFLGMACGPKAAADGASKGFEEQTKGYRELEGFAAEVLLAQTRHPDFKQFRSRTEAIASIINEVNAKYIDLRLRNHSNPEHVDCTERLHAWGRADGVFHQACNQAIVNRSKAKLD